MSSFSEEVPKIARTADVSAAQAAIRSVYGRQASNWIATKRELPNEQPGGGSRRPRRRRAATPSPNSPYRRSRWPSPPPCLCGRPPSTSARSRWTTGGVSQGWRSIGVLKRDDMRPELDGARRELREGNVEEAAYLFSVATLEAYSPGLPTHSR